MSQFKRYIRSSSGNGSRDVAFLQNDTSHTASTENVSTKPLLECQCPHVVRCVEN